MVSRSGVLAESACMRRLSRCVCWVQGKPYRFGYSVSAKMPTSYGNALSKFDMEQGTFKEWHEPGCIPQEPVMVPRPGAQARINLSHMSEVLVHYHGDEELFWLTVCIKMTGRSVSSDPELYIVLFKAEFTHRPLLCMLMHCIAPACKMLLA